MGSRKGWSLVIGSVVLYVLPSMLTTGLGGSALGVMRSPLGPLFEFWWLFLLAGGVFLVRDYGLTDRLAGEDLQSRGRRSGPLDREDIIEATNWKRVNFLVFRRSLGVSLAAAGAVALLLTLLIGRSAGGIAVAVASLLASLAGVVIFLLSRSHAEEIREDYTHRVSVRVPDLFEVHTFHVHLRQVAEDLGYVTSDVVSPGRGGVRSGFDDGVFLSEGGFTATKRPIAPPISPFPERSTLADAVNVTSASMTAMLVSVALVATQPSGGRVLVGALLFIGGLVGLVYSYVTRTRNWARMYCLVEGTVHTPTTNLYAESVGDMEAARVEPTVSSAESSTELIVTVGARQSRYFDEDQLSEDFAAFVSTLDDVAAANSYQVMDAPVGDDDRERVAGRA
ncbi:MAG: hypothetical protein ABEJ08_01640 [Halobacteriaceae archaeon]